MLLMAAVMGIGTSMIILQQPFLSSHGVGEDVGYEFVGLFLIPGQILAFGASLAAFRVSRALGVSTLVVLLSAVVLMTAIGLGAIDHLAAFAFYPPTTIGAAMAFIVISDYLNRRIPSANRATILSIHNMLFSFVAAGMELLLTVIGHWRGLPTAYWTGALVLAVVGDASARPLAAGSTAAKRCK